MAGVEPATVKLNGADPVACILSTNITIALALLAAHPDVGRFSRGALTLPGVWAGPRTEPTMQACA